MPQSRWLSALLAMTDTPEEAANYLDRRLRFTSAVARCLVDRNPQRDLLVYGVWLEKHSLPIYIGQTTGGRRRLWDLPIGESHHLANSFPPEIWSKVVVIYWSELLETNPLAGEEIEGSPLLTGGVGTSKPSDAIGLGLEYLLQMRFQPLMNRRKKRRDGGWREVAWDSSASIGARAAPYLNHLFASVVATWETLADIGPTDKAVVELSAGRVVFPALALVTHQ